MINGAFPDIVTLWTSLDPLLCSVTESKYFALFDPERNSDNNNNLPKKKKKKKTPIKLQPFLTAS